MPDYDDELARLMPDVAQRVLGKPTRARLGGQEWRWGRKGSLVIKPLRGVYTNFETGQGGGVLHLVRDTLGLSTLREAGEWLRAQGFLANDRRSDATCKHALAAAAPGGAPTGRSQPASEELPPTQPKPAAYWTLDGAPANTRRACEIWRTSIPLWDQGAAPAVAYLTGRGLPPPYPELAFARLKHPESREILPTLVVPRHCPVVGLVRGIQRIFIDPAGGKYRGGEAKMSLGTIAGGRAELLSEFRPERLLIGEGVETTMSAARLFGYATAWAMCGGFPGELVLRPWHRHVLLVADNDPSGGSEKRARALARWIVGTGRTCEVRMPTMVGADANDMIERAP